MPCDGLKFRKQGVGLTSPDRAGGSLETIARAKAGIMKRGRPVVVAPQPHPEVLQVLHDCAQALTCPLVGTEGHVRSCGPPRLAEGLPCQSLDILDPATGSPALAGLLPGLRLCDSSACASPAVCG